MVVDNGRSRRDGCAPFSLGAGMGSVIAGLISWDHTHALGWTILHVFGSWIYVIYSWITGKVSWS